MDLSRPYPFPGTVNYSLLSDPTEIFPQLTSTSTTVCVVSDDLVVKDELVFSFISFLFVFLVPSIIDAS